jgi:hypothetical protein
LVFMMKVRSSTIHASSSMQTIFRNATSLLAAIKSPHIQADNPHKSIQTLFSQ